MSACNCGKLKRPSSSDTADMESPLPVVSPTARPGDQQMQLQTQQPPSSTAKSHNDAKPKPAISKDTKPHVKVKPQIRVKPSATTASLDTQSKNGTTDHTSEDLVEGTYYNTMVLTAKVQKEHLKEYIKTAEENQELDKQYKVTHIFALILVGSCESTLNSHA